MLIPVSGTEQTLIVGWDEKAWRSAARNRTFMLPDVISERLDDLSRVLEDAGSHGTRSDIVACLLLAAPIDPGQLEDLVRAYKQATVSDAYLGDPNGDGLRLKEVHPGPRGRPGGTNAGHQSDS